VRAFLVKNDSISCSWLHLLRVWSLLNTRGDSHTPAFCGRRPPESRAHGRRSGAGKTVGEDAALQVLGLLMACKGIRGNFTIFLIKLIDRGKATLTYGPYPASCDITQMTN
jgi:hypothetical protein